MARRAEGWKLHLKGEYWYVRFTHEGRRYNISTGQSDRGKAEARGKKVYADIVSGRAHRQGLGVQRGLDLKDLLAGWLCDHTARADTLTSYEGYGRTFVKHFETLDNMTASNIVAFGRARLKQVVRSTVTKELHNLRAFLRWCKERGHLSEVPVVDLPSQKATGKRANPNRKRDWNILTEKEVQAIVNAMPEESKRACRDTGLRFPVRSFFIFLWETGLRESTVSKLEYGYHYKPSIPGRIFVTEEIDKNSFKRPLPITPVAEYAIKTAMGIGNPARKLIWGERDFRAQVRLACEKANIDPAKAASFSAYDIRHSRATQWAEDGELTAISYLLGHKQVSTTNRYVHPQEQGAERLLGTGE